MPCGDRRLINRKDRSYHYKIASRRGWRWELRRLAAVLPPRTAGESPVTLANAMTFEKKKAPPDGNGAGRTR